MEYHVMHGILIEHVSVGFIRLSLKRLLFILQMLTFIVVAISPNTNEIHIYDVRTKERKFTLTDVSCWYN